MRTHITLAALTALVLLSPAVARSQSNQSQQASITSVAPASIVQGATNLGLVVRGSGFTSKSQMRVNGEHRPTTFMSSSEIRASLLPLDVVAPRSSRVAVFTPSVGTTRELVLTVTAPVVAPAPPMSVSSLEPASAIPGTTSGANLAVRGAGFTNGMVMRWNGVDRPTSILLSSVISALVRPGDLASPGTANVTVYDPATGTETPAAVFYIDASRSGVPRIGSLGQNTAIAGTAFGTAINGEGFVFGSVVRVNGVALPPNQITYNAARIIGMQLTAAMIPTPGAYRITVFNPGPSGGESSAVTLTVNAQ